MKNPSQVADILPSCKNKMKWVGGGRKGSNNVVVMRQEPSSSMKRGSSSIIHGVELSCGVGEGIHTETRTMRMA